MHIGEKIRHFRELRNFDQKHMAKALDIHQATYSKIENGHDLSFSQLEKIAEVLEVKVQDLINFEPTQYFNHIQDSQIAYNIYINNFAQEIDAIKLRLSNLEQQTKNPPHQ